VPETPAQRRSRRPTLLWSPTPLPHSIQVGRSSPQTMDQPRLILLLRPKQTPGAYPYATCPGMPVGATNTTPLPANPSAVAPGKRRNRTPVYITGVCDARGFLTWLRALKARLRARHLHLRTSQSSLRVSAKPTSSPARAARWSLQQGAQRPGHCPELGPRLCQSLLPQVLPRKVQHRCVSSPVPKVIQQLLTSSSSSSCHFHPPLYLSFNKFF
jgi:hypothetical protein